MCSETPIYDAENFLTPCTCNNQTKFFEILLTRGFQKCILVPNRHLLSR